MNTEPWTVADLFAWMNAGAPVEEDNEATLWQIVPVELSSSEDGHLLVHFTHDLAAIERDGLLGTADHTRLGTTFQKTKPEPGWNFAYRAREDDARAALRPQDITDYGQDTEMVLGDGYGDHALVFSGVEHLLVRHHGDGDRQVIFRGADLDLDHAVRMERVADPDVEWEAIPDAAEWHVLDSSGVHVNKDPLPWSEAVEIAAVELEDRKAIFAIPPLSM